MAAYMRLRNAFCVRLNPLIFQRVEKRIISSSFQHDFLKYIGSSNNLCKFHPAMRFCSGVTCLSQSKRFYCQDAQSHSEDQQTPEELTKKELQFLHDHIRKELTDNAGDLQHVSQYYFDGKGKAFRPQVIMLVSKACNFHQKNSSDVNQHQMSIALITEMIHTASLMHDDVIDAATSRRNQTSINHHWGHKKSILAGDYVLARSSILLARIGNPEVIILVSQAIEDLVRGEFMQLGTKEDENERFGHYLTKTYKKTASLIANCSKAAAVLSGDNSSMHEVAYQYGRNIGMAFQIIDDVLDFVSSDKDMGKPTAVDLSLGLATAPVLFAAEKYPELNAMIMRRFKQPGDVEMARELVAKTDSIEQSRKLAQLHTEQALREVQKLNPSPESKALQQLALRLLKRSK